MDKFLVRILPIILNLYIIIVIICAWSGIDISIYDYWFSCPITMGILLSVLAHKQGKYHCRWIRALCYNLIFVPAITYFDAKFVLFENAYSYIMVITISMIITIFATIVLAVNHFRRVRKVTKGRYEELRPLNCHCARKDR